MSAPRRSSALTAEYSRSSVGGIGSLEAFASHASASRQSAAPRGAFPGSRASLARALGVGALDFATAFGKLLALGCPQCSVAEPGPIEMLRRLVGL